MSNKHSFNQVEVLMIGRCKRDQDAIWNKFINTAKELGYIKSVSFADSKAGERLYIFHL